MQQAPDTSSIQEPSKQQHAGSQAGTKVTGISRLLDSNQGLRVPIRDSHCAWVYREYEPQGREREYFLSPSSLSPLVTLQRKTPGGRRRELLLHPARTSLVTSDYARFPYFQDPPRSTTGLFLFLSFFCASTPDTLLLFARPAFLASTHYLNALARFQVCTAILFSVSLIALSRAGPSSLFQNRRRRR